jgi:K+-sensing histidine kinase KdpD
MHAGATADLDARAGAGWLATAGPADRLQLLAALLSRFNHDFRTPLNTITGWGHLLQQAPVEPARTKHVADVIARNAREQTVMLEAFVEDARVVLDRLPLEPATIRIDDVVAQVIARTGGSATPRCPLQVRMDAVDGTVYGEGRVLQRLLERLVDVIARRAQDGATVDLRVSREDRWICLALSSPARDADWSESDLCELRVATLIAAVFRGSLQLLAAPGSAALTLQLPEAARAK